MLPIPNPIAFNLFGLEIRWYAIIMVLAIFLALLLAYKRKNEFNITDNQISDYILWTVPISIVGARLYYVIFEWDHYKNNLIEILAIRHGGLAIHGAIIAGFIVTLIFCHYQKYPLLKFLDYIVPSLALGQAIGRWGNYFNMEAHGMETNFFLKIPILTNSDKIIYVHPTFLYESVWDLLLCLFLLYFQKHYEKRWGESTCLYLFIYSIGRFFIESLRTDSLYFFGLRQAQLISISLIIISIVLFIYIRRNETEIKKG